MAEKWYETSYRRNLVDMHIEDWDKRFLSKYDAKEYVETVGSANIKSVMVYANSHVGHCYWPTKSGHMHEGIGGRDILGEVTDLFHEKGIDVIFYYTLIFVNWAYNQHPDWRIIRPDGKDAYGLNSPRYGICCPNTGYRDWVAEQLNELCDGYDFEGVWPDMTFWPEVCYCEGCKKRFKEEVGEAIPTTVDWTDPLWVTFQRKRQEWLAEFGKFVTDVIQSKKPEATVTHQANAFLWDWRMGPSVPLAGASDFMAADFYGDSLQQSYASKFFYSISENVPFEFMTSRCPNLHHHTTTKSKEWLEAQTYSALSNGAGFLFIDAIDPVGTLNPDVYSIMGDIFSDVASIEKELGGVPCQDVAMYLSFESLIYPEDNGKNIKDVDSSLDVLNAKQPVHADAVRNCAKALLNNNVPYGVITKKNLSDLKRFQIIILPDVIMMDEDEVQAFTDFVASGGSIYATKYTSLYPKAGGISKDFLLADLFGVNYTGETKEIITYMAPTDEEPDLFAPYSGPNPLSIDGTQLKVKAGKQSVVLATMTLPYTDPQDSSRFASIHSNPPGDNTEFPSVVLNKFKDGKVLYIAGDLDVQYHDAIIGRLLGYLKSVPFTFESDAPKPVEITLFEQQEKNRYLVHMVNFQEELPNIPVEGITVRMNLPGKKPAGLKVLNTGKTIDYREKQETVEFTAPRLETYLLLALEYRA